MKKQEPETSPAKQGCCGNLPRAKRGTPCSSCGKEMSDINDDSFLGISAKAASFISIGISQEMLINQIGALEPEKIYTLCCECWNKYTQVKPS